MRLRPEHDMLRQLMRLPRPDRRAYQAGLFGAGHAARRRVEISWFEDLHSALPTFIGAG